MRHEVGRSLEIQVANHVQRQRVRLQYLGLSLKIHVSGSKVTAEGSSWPTEIGEIDRGRTFFLNLDHGNRRVALRRNHAVKKGNKNECPKNDQPNISAPAKHSNQIVYSKSRFNGLRCVERVVCHFPLSLRHLGQCDVSEDPWDQTI